MAGILSRFKTIMEANINALLDKAEDPVKMADQLARDLEKDLGEVKAETVSVMAEEKRAKRAYDEGVAEVEKLQRYAEKAVLAGNDADAKVFLSEKAAKAANLESLKGAWDLAAANAAKMREMHDKLTEQLKQVEDRKAAIRAKAAMVKSQQKANEIKSDLGGSSLAAFDALEEKLNRKLDEAEAARSQAEITCQEAKEAYEDKKASQPKMPEYSDYSSSAAGDFVTDGASEETPGLTDQASADASSAGSTVDTSAIENAIEQATSDLADLQSDLASQKSIAEADSASLTEEEKEKMRVSNNLTELDAKSAKELVEEGKKGISADFNGVISKSAVQQGAAATQGMELFTLQNTDKVSVDINVSKYDYDKVKEGQNADITIGDRKYTGKVTKISHIATTNEKGSTLISATVGIDKPDKDIFLGVDAKVKIYAEKAEDVVTLPAGVVNIGKDGSFCYVLKDGVITKQDITTGISSEDSVEITDGIKAGDEVIEDLGSLEEGMKAEAAAADSDSAAETGETANE